MIVIDEARCNGCGICLTACPQEAIVLEANRAEIKQELCTNCGVCLHVCPEEAIEERKLVPTAMEPAQAAPVEHAPAAVRFQQPEVLAAPRRSEAPGRVASALAGVAPVAVDLLARLAERWLERGGRRSEALLRGPGQLRRDVAGGGFGARGGGRRRRRRAGRQR